MTPFGWLGSKTSAQTINNSLLYLYIPEVKPYIVNDRLFSEPVKRSMFAQYDFEETDRNREKEKVPTYDEPRFVR